jgi:multiple sugar transport system substrate-binding protein
VKLKNAAFLRLMTLVVLACQLFCSCQKSGSGGGSGAKKEAAFVFHEKPATKIEFLSTQLNPVEEAGKMRSVILKDFPGEVDFRPNDSAFIYRQIDALLKKDPAESILLGALHGDFVKLYEEKHLRPLGAIYRELKGRAFIPGLLNLSRLDGKEPYYIPWMQASYVMAVNKKALKYLPRVVDVKALTYDQLYDWSVAILQSTGKFALGFPAGEKGLMHRFLQGYLYPSFTGSSLAKFRGAEAQAMWGYLKKLWRVTQPGSLNYSTMADPLLTDEVWIAWDHSARLIKVFEQRPEDFMAIPAPIGPKGRGFMAVVSGLGIPEGVALPKNPAILIDYLTREAIQERTLRETGFFPVIDVANGAAEGAGISLPLRELGAAVREQSSSPASITTLLPIGLGERGDDYNKLFMLTFSDIVLGGTDIAAVLNANAAKLQRILDESNASFWPPDKAGERPGKIE